MTRLPFGTTVTVAAKVEPRYLHWISTRTVFKPNGGAFMLGTEVTVDPPVLEVDSEVHAPDDLGDPLPDEPEIPAAGTHRRLRRFPTNRTRGIVVGWVWRAEGQYHAMSGYGHDPYTGEYDYEQAHLAECRRVPLYQLAVDPGETGNQFQPARIILAHPDDVKDRR